MIVYRGAVGCCSAPGSGIVYFVAGSGGQLRVGNIDRGSGITAKGFDTDALLVRRSRRIA